MRGADAARYLQGQLTNDVRRASTETAVYACVLTAKGRLCADVYLRAEPGGDGGGFLLDADAGLREVLAARLERYVIADDVTVEDVTDEFGLLHFPGGDLPVDLGDHVPAAFVARADRFGGMGTDVFLPIGGGSRESFEALRHDQLGQEAPADEAETRRIAAGVPRWGAELDEDTLPPEAGLEVRAISYDKGCYVGQETISRLKSIGHVNRHLRRLRAVGGPVPLAAGSHLHELATATGDGDGAGAPAPGREVGRVTSAAGSFALGYVRRGLEATGTRLLVVVDPGDPTAAAAAPREVEVAGPPYAPVS